MARTAEGEALTVQHRRAQLQIRARALQDYIRIWPLWQGDEASFWRLVAASVPLVRGYHGLSRSLGAGYFNAFRRAEGAAGEATPILADPIDEDRFRAAMLKTGAESVRRAIAGGRAPQAAMQTALTRTSGTASRFILQGGRDTVVLSTGEDRAAGSWSRVTAGNPCAFCAMVASRGPVFRGEDTAEFQAHDHCACAAEPHYEGSEWPGRGREFRDLYNRAQREAREAGDLKRGTANDSLNAFRRLLAG